MEAASQVQPSFFPPIAIVVGPGKPGQTFPQVEFHLLHRIKLGTFREIIFGYRGRSLDRGEQCWKKGMQMASQRRCSRLNMFDVFSRIAA